MRNIWTAVKAVLSAFSGVRRGKDAAPPELRPHHYVIAGLLAAAALVLALLAIVQAVV